VRDAIELYRKVVQGSGDLKLRAQAWSQIGSANAQLKRYDQAKESYENALEILPNDAGSLLGSGLLAEQSGNFSRAAVELRRSVNAEPSDVGFLLLAEALRRDQRPREAEAAEELARKISHDLSRAQEGARQTQLFFGCASPATASSAQTDRPR
jgi:tetratricopeptide (TPR) repeat protein